MKLNDKFSILTRLEILTEKELNEHCKKHKLKILTNRNCMWAGLHKARIELGNSKQYEEITDEMIKKSFEYCLKNGFSPYIN